MANVYCAFVYKTIKLNALSERCTVSFLPVIFLFLLQFFSFLSFLSLNCAFNSGRAIFSFCNCVVHLSLLFFFFLLYCLAFVLSGVCCHAIVFRKCCCCCFFSLSHSFCMENIVCWMRTWWGCAAYMPTLKWDKTITPVWQSLLQKIRNCAQGEHTSNESR